ncbi:hypothetical protein X474_13735 [Dethiosulfatarculus sandiegensis]|uniref:Uncharacterized protein n=1 Tax=Dethiosulfatarculus sandiegensis TaxID=1429043 RepID=A0A0D2GF69_9BACT|nr:hypothetical protein X474_13735 [Dethiosulfatarculus sandiegensis]
MALGEPLPDPVFITTDKSVMEKRFQKAAVPLQRGLRLFVQSKRL